MIVFPNKKRVAVSFAFDVDLELNWSESNRLDSGHLVHMSKGTYGAKQGIPRILNMLDTHDVKSTFFVPAYNATVYPDLIREIHRRGHEIGNHNVHHFDDPNVIPAKVLKEAEEILWDVCRVKPVGFRPTTNFRPKEDRCSEELGKILMDLGYYYISFREDCDGPKILEIEGKKYPLVDLMASDFYDDTVYDYYVDSPPVRYGIKSAAQQMEIWRDEFDGLAEEGGKIMNFLLHPQFFGRAGRVNALGELIAYMKARGAWITTNAEIAQYFLKANGLL